MGRRDELFVSIPEDVANAMLGAIRAEMMGFEADCLDIHGIEYFDRLMKGGAILLEGIERAEAKRKEADF